MATTWQLPPTQLDLARGKIDCWFACADQPPEFVKACKELLNAVERKRAERFYFTKHQRRFAVARGTLRRILSLYLEIPAGDIEFDYSDHGKPSISEQQNPKHVSFNLSHSGEWILLGVTQHDALGVDIEQRSDRCTLDIAKRFFAPAEVEQLCELPPNQQQGEFFHIWTQKEAFIKAVGEGLSYPLDKFEVSVNCPAGLHVLARQPEAVGQWQLRNIDTLTGVDAALAIKHPITTLNYFANSQDLSKL